MDLFNIPELLSTYGYAGVAIIVFLESGIFFPLPGDSLLFTAGLLASGVGFNLNFLIPLIFVSTLLGGIAGYYVGVYLDTLRRYAFFRKFLKEHHIDAARVFFEKHGRLAVILSRFFPVIRTFVPIVAGMVKMEFHKFLRYSIISSLLWSTSMTLAGYFLGRRFPQIHDYLSYILIAIVLGSAIPLGLEWLRERRKRRSRTSE